MSNYDFGDNWTPYDEDYRKAEGGNQHCGELGEHGAHKYSLTPYDNYWRRRRPGPYFICPGTEARAERFKDMLIHFHDDGKVTWSKPENVELALIRIQNNREEAALVAFQKKDEVSE